MKFYHKLEDHDNPATENVWMHITHKFKYRIMWELRSLEKEIDAEGGIIMFYAENDKDWVETKNFSPDLDARIWKILRAIDYSKW